MRRESVPAAFARQMAELQQRMDGAFWAAQDAGALGCVERVGRTWHRPGEISGALRPRGPGTSGRGECSGACRCGSAGALLSGAGTSLPRPRSRSGISAARAARRRPHVQGGLARSWAVAAQFEEDAAAVLVAPLAPAVRRAGGRSPGPGRPRTAARSLWRPDGTSEPSSRTSIRAHPGPRNTVTSNVPPAPESVCCSAFVHSSEVSKTASSSIGQPGPTMRRTKSRAHLTWSCRPGNMRLIGLVTRASRGAR